VAISRWLPDETRDADGFFIYLRDLDDDAVWSAGYQPTRVAGVQYDFQYDRGVAQIQRVDREITCSLAICVSPDVNCEIRRCELTNLGDRKRRIELTSYLEWVLGNGEADAGHPAFSKLFVETQYCADRRAILARRRPRHSDDSEFWGFHSIAGSVAEIGRKGLEFETNRLRFIGRGRTLARPLALDPGAKLSGDYGPVLDPIASLRTVVLLEPGESRHVVFALGGAQGRAEIDDLLASVRESESVDRLFASIQTTAGEGTNGSPASDSAIAALARRVIIHPPHQLGAVGWADGPADRTFAPAAAMGCVETPPSVVREQLQFENSYGGFSADGREYIVRLDPDGLGGHRRPPAPWVNVIANERAGFLHLVGQ
jgi:cyclic beta-1,2-glucan synthetase